MKTGAENRKWLVAAIVCVVLALFAIVRMVVVLRESPPVSASAKAPGATGPQARRVRAGSQAKLPAHDSLDPTLRLDLLKASEQTQYKGAGRNIFSRFQAPIPTAPDPRKDHEKDLAKGPPPPVCPGPDPRCPPPPIPLKFYGFASKAGEPKKIFLSSNDGDVFIAGEGEIVNRRYRVLRIGVNSVEIEDVLQNNRQTLPLTQGN